MLPVNITPENIINTLVSSNGNVKLAAERLCTQNKLPFNTITEEDILTSVIGDNEYSSTLINQLKTKFILQLFESLSMTNYIYQGSISGLEAKEIVKAMKALGDIFAVMTNKTNENAVETFTALAAKVTESLIKNT